MKNLAQSDDLITSLQAMTLKGQQQQQHSSSQHQDQPIAPTNHVTNENDKHHPLQPGTEQGPTTTTNSKFQAKKKNNRKQNKVPKDAMVAEVPTTTKTSGTTKSHATTSTASMMTPMDMNLPLTVRQGDPRDWNKNKNNDPLTHPNTGNNRNHHPNNNNKNHPYRTNKQKGRNTESFDPVSTMVRPDIRVQIGSSQQSVYNKPIKHDDVVIVPELFGSELDWTMYHTLVQEITALQENSIQGSDWIRWHEGSHWIVQNPNHSPTFHQIIDRLCEYFQIQRQSVGTRFNWYQDSSDWKPFHHDSA